MTPRTFESPAAFKQALEQRLRNTSASGADFSRRRQLIVFERFLARIFQFMGDLVVLKGGLVLELRLERARTTKDVDLRLFGAPKRVLEQLQQAGRIDLGDFLSYEVRLDPRHPKIQNDGMPYGGLRFRAEAMLAGKLFGQAFGVDVAFGDMILGEPDVIVAKDVLSFAGIAPPKLRLYPLESHIAEKLHAYTMPRARPNSRVKDLPDLALLAKVRVIDAKLLRDALEQTFAFRGTHDVPATLPEPPSSWDDVYRRMAEDDELEWRTLPELVLAVGLFLDPILGDKLFQGHWMPENWDWSKRD
ncbi:MAG: nucleotidyl transferase AbiEii/AbiGii toxin family protein [Deltaproteobacteria bacterium]|nr:nucleotidyl transferase AbiEii/AbiGii toxin family protein [Deltaproteobacteria bacterium]